MKSDHPFIGSRLALNVRIRRAVKRLVSQEFIDACVISISGFRETRAFGCVLRCQDLLAWLLPVPWHRCGWKISNGGPFTDFVNSEASTGIAVRALRQREDVALPPPKTVVGELCAPLFSALTKKYNPEFSILSMRRGHAFDDGRNIAILTQDGRVIGDVATTFIMPNGRHPAQLLPRMPRLQKLKGQSLFLSTAGASDNYYHWMIELLPKFLGLRAAGIDPKSFDHILVNSAKLPFQKETLDIFGVPTDALVFTSEDPPTFFKGEELYIPTHTCRTIAPRWAIDLLRSNALVDHQKTPQRRIYISRADASRRRCVNENVVEEFFLQKGFEVLTLGKLTVREQIKIFAESSAIVGMHGAGMSNLVFAPLSCRVCEIFAPNYIMPFYWGLSATLGLDYTYFCGDPVHGQRQRHNTADVLINIGVLEELMRKWQM